MSGIMNGESLPKANSSHPFQGVKESKTGFFTAELEKSASLGHWDGAVLCAGSPLFEKCWGNNIPWFLDSNIPLEVKKDGACSP